MTRSTLTWLEQHGMTFEIGLLMLAGTYCLVASTSAFVSSQKRSDLEFSMSRQWGWGETEQKVGFYYRNNLILSAFWPATLCLLFVDAIIDYRRELRRKNKAEALALATEQLAVQVELVKANRQLDKQLDRQLDRQFDRQIAKSTSREKAR